MIPKKKNTDEKKAETLSKAPKWTTGVNKDFGYVVCPKDLVGR